MSTESKCRCCGKGGMEIFYELRQIPVHSCLLVATREEALRFPRGDLSLGWCGDCGFIQNTRFDAEQLDYGPDYEETQAFSPRFQKYVEELCDEQSRRYALEGKLVVEIGCGKGEFLEALCRRARARGIGFDPAYRPDRGKSTGAGGPEFRRERYGERHASLSADYVCCRHTLEHVPDAEAFVRMLRKNLDGRDRAVVFFEVPDTERILEEQAFWDIYYEHCSYFTSASLSRLFARCGFDVLELRKVYDGQYLTLEARPSAGSSPSPESGETARSVARFREGVAGRLETLRGDLRRLSGDGRRVVLWGSGSKAVGYLTTLGVGSEVQAVVDINPHKQGKYLAGTGHAIIGPDELRTLRPDAVVVMNPVYAGEIRADLEKRGLAPEIATL